MLNLKLFTPHTFHERMMMRCLELAQTAWATARPNPLVGAVVLDAVGQNIVGEGFHLRSGGPHAEVLALQQAGDLAKGGTLFVNLEPCNHYGKTPPCTKAIIEAGLSKVVFGLRDPNPKAAGGVERLREAGILVEGPVFEPACLALNEPFITSVKQQRPFVTLKLALTLDGKVATRNGQSQWLTGAYAKRWVHGLRSGQTATLTTARTAAADRCQLTVRDTALPPDFVPPVRLLLDRRLSLNPVLHPLSDTQQAPTVVFCSEVALKHKTERVSAWQEAGAQVVSLPVTAQQELDLKALWVWAWEQRLTSVLVEAGAQLSHRLLDENWVNTAHFIYAAKAMHDSQALTPFQGKTPWHVSQASAYRLTNVQHWDQDVCMTFQF
jgi:diaminohydroxyphosphoribosylaminopyrimidine deaminase / 5-amino-6-(5-phosphoribosylamino)uracil reductase